MTSPDVVRPELLPCPFCGSKAALLIGDLSGAPFVGCMGTCRVDGPKGHDEEADAITAWNRWASPASPAGEPRPNWDTRRIKDAIRQILEIANEHKGFGGHRAIIEAIAEIDDASDRLAIRAAARPPEDRDA